MKKISKREWVHVVLMLGVLVVGVRCGEAEHDHGNPLLTYEGALLVRDRAGLQVCVQMAPGLESRSEELRGAVQQELKALGGRHPDWGVARFNQQPVQVQQGCPGGKLPEGRLEKGATVGPGLTGRPSPFRTFVYVVDDALADKLLGDQPAGYAPAEFMRQDDHVLVEVSSALIVRASALGTASFQETWLPMGLGLSPLRELPAPATDSLPKN